MCTMNGRAASTPNFVVSGTRIVTMTMLIVTMAVVFVAVVVVAVTVNMLRTWSSPVPLSMHVRMDPLVRSSRKLSTAWPIATAWTTWIVMAVKATCARTTCTTWNRTCTVVMRCNLTVDRVLAHGGREQRNLPTESTIQSETVNSAASLIFSRECSLAARPRSPAEANFPRQYLKWKY